MVGMAYTAWYVAETGESGNGHNASGSREANSHHLKEKAITTLHPRFHGNSPQAHSHFDLSNPLDVAVFACLTTFFYASARLGEFVVRKRRFRQWKICFSQTPVTRSGSEWAQSDSGCKGNSMYHVSSNPSLPAFLESTGLLSPL